MITLETERLIIRDHILDDLDSHHKLLSDDKVMYYLQDIKSNSYDESKENLLASIEDATSPTREFYFLKIVDKQSGCHIGEIGYSVTDFTSDGMLYVHLGYFTYTEHWNKGYVTEALREIIRFAFEDNNVYKISTGCLVCNFGSEKVMQKCGLIRGDETLVLHDNETKTRVLYSLLKSEWKNKR